MENVIPVLIQVNIKIVLCCVGADPWLAYSADELILGLLLVVAVSDRQY